MKREVIMSKDPGIFPTAKRLHDEIAAAEHAILRNSTTMMERMRSLRGDAFDKHNQEEHPNLTSSSQSSDIRCARTQVQVAGVKRSLPETESRPIKFRAATSNTNSNTNNAGRGKDGISEEARQRIQQNIQYAKICREYSKPKREIIEKIKADTPYKLSSEQLHILQTIRPPRTGGSIVRITAAAGTGKTETLLKLAEVATGIGHQHITYLTFNKSAASDAQKRLDRAFLNFANLVKPPKAITIHACAMKELSIYEDAAGNTVGGKFIKGDGGNEWLDLIQELCEEEIEDFLFEYKRNISTGNFSSTDKHVSEWNMINGAKRKVSFYLMKTLQKNFCQSDLSSEAFLLPETFNTIYYPAKMYHSNDGRGEGFDGYQTKLQWYPNTAAKLWQKLKDKGIRSYDLEMKQAQLLKLEIPGTCILVDESQDCNACQISWLSNQIEYGSQVYFVGDAAQTIYSFRGAKSEYLMALECKTKCTLTQSWRFGPAIGRMANFVLFAKQNSPQTVEAWDDGPSSQRNNKTSKWEPYRVKGNGSPQDIVTTKPISIHWQSQKVTIIARCNATLLIEAMQLLGFKSQAEMAMENERGSDAPVVTQEDDDIEFDFDLPKIHVNGGSSESSGIGKWRKVVNEVGSLFDLYMHSIPPETTEEIPDENDRITSVILDEKLFPEFKGESVTWEQFNNRVKDEELTKYATTLGVIHTFKSETERALDKFEAMVLDAEYNADQADVILTTAHAAKGQEWDNVQVCNDFHKLEVKPPEESEGKRHKKRCGITNHVRDKYQFEVNSYGDDLNLLYVAITRGKKLLSAPKYLRTLLQECDEMNSWMRALEDFPSEKCDEEEYSETNPPRFSGVKGPTLNVALALFDDITMELRKENGVDNNNEDLLSLYFNGDRVDRPSMHVIEK